MIYQNYVDESHRQIAYLLSEAARLESELAEAYRTIDELQVELTEEESLTTRDRTERDLSVDVETDRERQPPPEMRSEISDSKKRIRRAIKFFTKHFNVDGAPKTDLGEKLTKRHNY